MSTVANTELCGVYKFDQKAKWFHEPLEVLPSILSQEQLLFAPFSTVRIAVAGIPFQLFTEDTKEEPSAENDVWLYDQIDGLRDEIRYTLPKVFIKEIREFYSDASLCHSASAVLAIASREANPTQDEMFVQLLHGIVEIAHVHHGRVTHLNQYKWTHENDVVYYVSAVADLMDSNLDKVHLFGPACSVESYKRLMHQFGHESTSPVKEEELRFLSLRNLAECV